MCFESKEMMKVPQMATKAPSLNRLLNIGDDKEGRAKRQAPITEQNATDNLNKARNSSFLENSSIFLSLTNCMNFLKIIIFIFRAKKCWKTWCRMW